MSFEVVRRRRHVTSSVGITLSILMLLAASTPASADGRSRTTLRAQETRINGGLAARLFEHASLR